MKTCKKCKKEYKNTGHAQKYCPECKTEVPHKPASRYVPLVEVEEAEEVPEFIILNLEHYPHILPALTKDAIKDFRTAELQAAYYLDMMVSGPSKKQFKKKDPLDDL